MSHGDHTVILFKRLTTHEDKMLSYHVLERVVSVLTDDRICLAYGVPYNSPETTQG